MDFGAETPLDLTSLLDVLQEAIAASGPQRSAALNRLPAAAAQAIARAEASCQAALGSTEAAYRAKTTTPSHPLEGKTLAFADQPQRVAKRDGSVIITATRGFTVA